MYNRYQGNTGRVERVEDGDDHRPPGMRPMGSPLPPPSGTGKPAGTLKRPPGPLHGLRSSLDGILSHLDPGKLKTEDYIVLLILYLMYRETGEFEYLIALGAFVFL
jgi:hypothetical protein